MYVVIRINKNSVNNIVVTLTENSTVANPIYLFKFTDQQSKKDCYFIASDTSAFTQRFNQFSVTEKENPNTLIGEVELLNQGFYNYTIYQTDLVNTSGLATAADAVSHIVKSVEEGLVWVVPFTKSSIEYDPQASDTIIYTSDAYTALLDEFGNELLSESNNVLIQE